MVEVHESELGIDHAIESRAENRWQIPTEMLPVFCTEQASRRLIFFELGGKHLKRIWHYFE